MVALASLAMASAGLQAFHSSADSILLASFSCQVDWDIVLFSAATLRGDVWASIVTTGRARLQQQVVKGLVDFLVEVVFAI